jgi:hypothetical protein
MPTGFERGFFKGEMIRIIDMSEYLERKCRHLAEN